MSSVQDSSGILEWSRGCYGVDARGDQLIAVRAERTRGGVACVPVAAAATERIASEGLPVVAALTVRESLTRWVEAPFASLSKARRVFATLLDIQLPFALEECYYTILDAERTEAGTCRGLAAAARREHVAARLQALADRGLDAVVLDQEGPALWTQALRERPRTDAAPSRRVVLYIGASDATLVQGEGDRFMSVHPVRVDDPTRMLRLISSTDEEGEGARDVEWVLTGPGAAAAVDSDLLDPLGPAAHRHLVDDPDTFLARAVATRALLGGRYICNLRLGDRAHPRLLTRRRRRDRVAAACVLAAGVVLCGLNVAARGVMAARQATLKARVRSAVAEAAGYPVTAVGRDAVRVVADEVTARKTSLAPFVRAVETSLTGPLAGLAQVAATAGLTLESLMIEPDAIEIAGSSPDWDRAERLVGWCEANGFVAALKRGNARADERIPFTFTAERAHD